MTMPSPNLDPADWDRFRADAHRALDGMIDHLASLRDRPVWREAPQEVRAAFDAPLPRAPRAFGAVLDDIDRLVTPYVTGNTHPLFMGWVHGAGTPAGMVAEMIAAGLDANCGGRNHIGLEVERQITRWMAGCLGLPADASGLFVTGSSMANFIALLVARTRLLGPAVRGTGLQSVPQRLTAYASAEAHQCIGQAMELSGLGSGQLRLIATDARRAMRPDMLAEAIAADRAAGFAPFLVVATAGSVNTGALDPLATIADVAAAEGLWLHVDGAIGAVAALSPELRPGLAGIERADSVALDFHKWMHVPYDAGFVLVRDPALHLQTFSSEAVYLSRADSGLARRDVWPCDLGPDLSRGFRALKTWVTLQTFGADQLGACMAQCCATARHLAARLADSCLFEVHAEVTLNIVCFGLKAADRRNPALIEALHASGLAAPSLTLLDGRPVIRAAIVNHRTTCADMDDFVGILTQLALANP
jgi:glutamate/tyrosine decarboxylase-like PLP-dependent enzyme